MTNTTEFRKVWYRYCTGAKGKREHLELKFLCAECGYVWDRQGYAFRFCPGCGKRITEITDEKRCGDDD